MISGSLAARVILLRAKLYSWKPAAWEDRDLSATPGTPVLHKRRRGPQ